MINEYVKVIKQERIKRQLTQQQMADKLEISRPSYISLEQGKKELSLSEAKKLSEILGFSFSDTFISSGDYTKYKQMILAFIREAGSPIDGSLPKTKLAKLVYLADFAWFYSMLESMSGMQYRKIAYGPVPDAYFRAIDELADEGLISIKQTSDGAMLIGETRAGKTRELSSINQEEGVLIKNIAKKWKNKNTKEIVSFTHNQLPYAICSDNEIIPYELITQEDPENVY